MDSKRSSVQQADAAAYAASAVTTLTASPSLSPWQFFQPAVLDDPIDDLVLKYVRTILRDVALNKFDRNQINNKKLSLALSIERSDAMRKKMLNLLLQQIVNIENYVLDHEKVILQSALDGLRSAMPFLNEKEQLDVIRALLAKCLESSSEKLATYLWEEVLRFEPDDVRDKNASIKLLFKVCEKDANLKNAFVFRVFLPALERGPLRGDLLNVFLPWIKQIIFAENADSKIKDAFLNHIINGITTWFEKEDWAKLLPLIQHIIFEKGASADRAKKILSVIQSASDLLFGDAGCVRGRLSMFATLVNQIISEKPELADIAKKVLDRIQKEKLLAYGEQRQREAEKSKQDQKDQQDQVAQKTAAKSPTSQEIIDWCLRALLNDENSVDAGDWVIDICERMNAGNAHQIIQKVLEHTHVNHLECFNLLVEGFKFASHQDREKIKAHLLKYFRKAFVFGEESDDFIPYLQQIMCEMRGQELIEFVRAACNQLHLVTIPSVSSRMDHEAFTIFNNKTLLAVLNLLHECQVIKEPAKREQDLKLQAILESTLSFPIKETILLRPLTQIVMTYAKR